MIGADMFKNTPPSAGQAIRVRTKYNVYLLFDIVVIGGPGSCVKRLIILRIDFAKS